MLSSSDETASLANDATTPSDTSHHASQPRLITYTRLQDSKEDIRGAHQRLNDTWTSQSVGSTAQVDDAGCDASLLTQQALHQHNAENRLANFKPTKNHSHESYHMYSGYQGGTTRYASILDGHECPNEHVEPYSYPRQSPGFHLPFALVKGDGQYGDEDTQLHFSPVTHQDVHPYPTYITEADLHDYLADAGVHNDLSYTKSLSTSSCPNEGYFQQVSVAYAGIGAQFSS